MQGSSSARERRFENLSYRIMWGGSTAILLGFLFLAMDFIFTGLAPSGLPFNDLEAGVGLAFLGGGFYLYFWGLTYSHRPKD